MRLVSAVLAVGFVGVIASLWLRPAPGRYQLVAANGDVLHRLDTATGDMQAFSLDDAEPRALGRVSYWPLAAAEGGAGPEWTRALVADAWARRQADAEQAAAQARTRRACTDRVLNERRQELEAKVEATRLRRGDRPLDTKTRELLLWAQAAAECEGQH